MQHKFSHRFSPPAPLVALRVHRPGRAQARQVESLVDSGADFCALPRWVVSILQLRAEKSTQSAGVVGRARPVALYRVDLDLVHAGGSSDELTSASSIGSRIGHYFRQRVLGPWTFPGLWVDATPLEVAILGREVLRHLKVTIDGPRQILRLTRPRTPPDR